MKENFEGTQVPDLMAELIQRVRSEIPRTGKTSAQVAKDIGMTPQTFSDLLSGHRGSISQVIRVLNKMGFKIEIKLKRARKSADSPGE